MRYAVSGHATAAILQVSGQNLVSILGRNVTTGRAFWMRGCLFKNTASLSAIWVFDCSAGTPATGDAATTKYPSLIIPAATGIQFNTGVFDFPAPGVKFTTGVCAAANVSNATTATGGLSVWGYEE